MKVREVGVKVYGVFLGLLLALLLALGAWIGPDGGYNWVTQTGRGAYQAAYVTAAWPLDNGVVLAGTLRRLGHQVGAGAAVTRWPDPRLISISWSYWLRHGVAWRYAMLHERAGAPVRALLPWAVGLLVLVLVLLAARLATLRRLGGGGPHPSSVYGDARWATAREVRRLRPRRGHDALLLGRVRRGPISRPVALSGSLLELNTLLVGPPGSSKSAGIIKTNLLRETGQRSLVVTDPKGECYDDTAGALAHTHTVYRLDFLDDTRSCGWNPLAACTDVLSARAFAETWIANTGTSVNTPYWQNTAALLITAAVLHLNAVAARLGGVATLPELADFLTRRPLADIEKTLLHSPGPEACATAAQYLRGATGDAALRAGIASEFHPRFALLQDPQLRAITSRNDIDVAAMADPAHPPTALFVVLPPGREHVLKPLTAAFFMQLFTTLVDRARSEPGQALRRPVFLYMDEAGTLGQIPHLDGWLNVCRQARLGAVLAVQTLAQLVQLYGVQGRDAILTACATKVAFSGLEYEDAVWFSAVAGQRTVLRQHSGEADAPDGWRAHRGATEAQSQLILPQQIQTMPRDEMLVLLRTQHPLKVRQRRWYTSHTLRQRAALPPPQPSPQATAPSAPVPPPSASAAASGHKKLNVPIDWAHPT